MAVEFENHSESREQQEQAHAFSNGETISPKEFIDLILDLEDPHEVTLITMAYGVPLQEGNATKVHSRLLSLADSGTHITVGVDNTYGRRIASQSDLPLGIAKKLGQRAEIDRQLGAYAELAAHPNINFCFNGSDNPPRFPMSKIDHRKILLVTNSDDGIPNYGVVFGFNINAQLEPQLIDTATYIDDPQALQWLQEYSKTPHYTPPTKVEFDSMAFITRELTPEGNQLAEKEVLEVINSAKEGIVFCSQWLPDADVFSALSDAAKRGVRLSIFSNVRPFKDEPMYGYFRAKWLKELTKVAKQTGNVSLRVQRDRKKLIHLKGLIVDWNTPNAQAITGTDNMSNRVLQNLGLREVLIRLKDPQMISRFLEHIGDNILPESVPYDLNRSNKEQDYFPTSYTHAI